MATNSHNSRICSQCKMVITGDCCRNCGTGISSATEQQHSFGYSDFKQQQLGPYKIQELIGKGGMGRIYKAIHTALFKEVALKIISIDAIGHEAYIVDRFIQEAQLTAKLRHPNIVTVYHAGNVDNIYYIAMDLIKGQTLAQLIDAKRLSIDQTLDIIAQVASALQFAHEYKIIHRDIKPSNIMLDESGTPILMDFGLAKDVSFNAALTQSGNIVGSPHYMSPEQAQGQKLDHRSDIFSLGAVFYEMLTFRKAFSGESSLAIIQNLAIDEPPDIRKIAPNVHKDVETICMKCLEKMPIMRYANAGDIAGDINCFRKGEVIKASPASLLARAIKWTRRNKLAAVALSITLCCLGVATIFFMIIRQLNQHNLQQERERQLYQHLKFTSRQIAKEIELNWLQTINDGRVLAASEPLVTIMEKKVDNELWQRGLTILHLWKRIKSYQDIFLLSRQGICTISTNPKFLGVNYTFRPYYQQASQNRKTIFYAIGTRSKKPGYFCGVPAHRAGILVGVCVIKFAIEPIAGILDRTSFFKSQEVFLVDEHGVLIQSNRVDIPLLCLYPLAKETQAQIAATRQFLGNSLRPLGLKIASPKKLSSHGISKAINRYHQKQVVLLAPLQKFPYKILVLIDYEELRQIGKRLP